MNRKQKRKAPGKWGGVVGVVLLLLIGAGWKLTSGLGEGQRVIFVNDEGVEVRQLEAGQGRGVSLKLPENLMVPVKGMQGKLRLGSLIEFAEDEGEPFKIVRRSGEILLGAQVDGVIYQQGKSKGLRTFWRRLSFKGLNKLSWWWGWTRLEKGKLVELKWSESWGEVSRRADGEEVIEVDRRLVWDRMLELLGTGRLRKEELGVRVINASGYQGLGYLATSMLETEGAVVVKVGAGEVEEGLCTVSYQKENEVVKWIHRKWGCLKQKAEQGDVVVKLQKQWGERYQRKL